MGLMDILNMVLAIITGLVTAIPLIIKLVEYIKTAAKEKNWGVLMQLVLKLMAEAENNFSTGAEREEFVIDSIKAMEATLNYEIDEEAIRSMIRAIVDVTKQVNINK